MALLRESDRPVTEVALDVGFQSLGTFSRTFREVVGESPRAYRERAMRDPFGNPIRLTQPAPLPVSAPPQSA